MGDAQLRPIGVHPVWPRPGEGHQDVVVRYERRAHARMIRRGVMQPRGRRWLEGDQDQRVLVVALEADPGDIRRGGQCVTPDKDGLVFPDPDWSGFR